jgi:fumarylacetoacetate (FAA) hydrolase
MRLATVFDTEINEPRPVFELPGGQRVELRELFRAPGVAESLDGMPLYFTDLAKTVQHLDDVIAAVRAWATQRSETASSEESFAPRATSLPFCPPIPAPRAFRNFDAFEEHVKTSRARRGQEMSPAWYDEPAFAFANSGSLVGHESPVQPPHNAAELDFGLELGLIIGTGGRNIRASEVWNHVAGFTIVNTLCARNLQRRELSVGMGTSKGRDFATAVGPYLVTLDALRDRIDSVGRIHLNMTARINGKVVSRGDAASMYFSWPTIVEHASRDADLYPGDLLSSGTVGGGSILEIGTDKTEGWLKAGDVVELEIERLGVLRTPIAARPNSVRTEVTPLAASAAD